MILAVWDFSLGLCLSSEGQSSWKAHEVLDTTIFVTNYLCIAETPNFEILQVYKPYSRYLWLGDQFHSVMPDLNQLARGLNILQTNSGVQVEH
jgi:hypothetical protein